MNKISKKGYAILSSILIISIAVSSLCLHFFSKANNSQQISTKGSETDYASIERDTSLSVDSSGVLQISRNERKEEKIMGKENTWTIFMYLCGSNLESQYQGATTDIEEILSANFNSENIQNVNILIQTGGSRKWHSNDISNNKIQRYKVDENSDSLTLLQELDNANMGNASTLYDFLDWGVSNYPAEHMGVIFWNHGAGVSNGVCCDENYNDSSLSVHELEYTFAKLNRKMTSKFEMISFDTCLSGSLEYANILAPYAKYMIASADIEPGDGWFYTDAIDYLLNNPDASGQEFGKIICDTYADYYDELSKSSGRPINYTLATYDLSKAANACIETNYLAKFLFDKLNNGTSEYWELSDLRSSCQKYAFDNADIGSIIDYLNTTDKYSYNTNYFKKSIDDLVIYSRLSEKYAARKASAITLYTPGSNLNLAEINYYRNLCFSPYWFRFIELMNFESQISYSRKFQPIAWESSPYFFETNFNFLNYENYDDIGNNINAKVNDILMSNPAYSSDGFPSAWYNNIDIPKQPNQYGFYSRQINTDMKINYDNKELSSQVVKEDLDKIKAVYNTIFTKENDSLICLGQNNKVSYNKETGEIKSNFNSEWFMLPDGQLLTAYIVSQDDKSTVYSFPVMIDDVESSIRVEEINKGNGENEYITLGVWDSNDNEFNKDNFSRGYLPLNSGTAIIPIYDVFNEKNETYETEYGEEYIINGNFEFLFGKLEQGEYSLAYEIKKLNDVSSYSEIKDFSINNDNLTIK